MKRGLLLFGFMLFLFSGFSQTKDVIFYNHHFFISEPIPENILSRMKGKSLPDKALIQVEDLRYLTIPYYDFNGEIQQGEMVCNKAIAHDLLVVFCELFHLEYPINSIRLVDDFDADDEASMEANNTSCFNYRNVPGTTNLSKHALGMAVDINPLQNPWIPGKKVYPVNAVEYVDRTRDFPHKIDHDDACYRIMKARGFFWGGDWKRGTDYQHFHK